MALESADKHPFQPYLVITGSSDGSVGVWDLRNECYPVAIVDAHESEGNGKINTFLLPDYIETLIIIILICYLQLAAKV